MTDKRKRKLDIDERVACKTTAHPNPYTGVPYSESYYRILEKRKGGDRVETRVRSVRRVADLECKGRLCGDAEWPSNDDLGGRNWKWKDNANSTIHL